MPGTSNDNRAEVLKKLLIKFRRSFTVQLVEGSSTEDFDEFTKLLDLNSQLATPKNLCINCWSLVSDAQGKTHAQQHHHKIVSAENFSSKETFLEQARSYGKL
jgi:hypothetical protein